MAVIINPSQSSLTPEQEENINKIPNIENDLNDLKLSGQWIPVNFTNQTEVEIIHNLGSRPEVLIEDTNGVEIALSTIDHNEPLYTSFTVNFQIPISGTLFYRK